MAQKCSKEEFISKCIQKFGDKFNYDKVQYINSKTKTIFTCPIHEDFENTPNQFLRSVCGCPKCGHQLSNNTRKMSQEDFLKRLKDKFGDKYDYSKVDYQGQKKSVTLICPIHGEFTQRADEVLNLNGCPKCSGYYSYTLEDVQMMANKHNISILNYINSKNPIHYRCNKCGFESDVRLSTLKNNIFNCPECSRQLKNKKFLEKVYQRNPNIIVLEEYQKLEEPVLCKCKVCNMEWRATPHNLMNGTSCPNCSTSKGEREVKSFLIKHNIKFIPQYMIRGQFGNRNKIFVDFYLPNLNCIIEYNGIQHYISVERFGGEIALQNQLQRDEDLRSYCKNCNIRLIEIKYTENISDILNNLLKEV